MLGARTNSQRALVDRNKRYSSRYTVVGQGGNSNAHLRLTGRYRGRACFQKPQPWYGPSGSLVLKNKLYK